MDVNTIASKGYCFPLFQLERNPGRSSIKKEDPFSSGSYKNIERIISLETFIADTQT